MSCQNLMFVCVHLSTVKSTTVVMDKGKYYMKEFETFFYNANLKILRGGASALSPASGKMSLGAPTQSLNIF